MQLEVNGVQGTNRALNHSILKHAPRNLFSNHNPSIVLSKADH